MSTLTTEQKQKFLADVKRLGLDPALVEKEGKQKKEVEVASLKEFKNLVGPLNPEMAKEVSLCAGPNNNILSQAAAYAFGNHQLTQDQIQQVEKDYFPTKVTVIAETDKVVPAGETWFIAKCAPPTVCTFGSVTMEPGSRIEVYGTYLTFNCQKFIRQS